MQFPIVREYKLDLLQKNEENVITGEPIIVPAGLYERVVVPRHAPFFVESLSLTTERGEPLFLGVDYDIYSTMAGVTGLAGQEVACFIRFLNPNVTSALGNYHVVGELSLLDNTLLNMIAASLNDKRPVFFEGVTGKPVAFPPLQHSHSLIYEITSFQDTIDFLNDIINLLRASPDALQLKIDHFTLLINWYITLYGNMLNEYLDNHATAHDAHGLTAKQAKLELVDNYSTASFADVLQARGDQHLRPTELRTLIESFSFSTDEFMPSKQLPIAQFGSTNFIPPNIDGSFEGFGGVLETGGMCLENDSSIVYLWNRMDGRIRGLYYSVMTNADNREKAKLIYTGYKYEHPRFVPDAANVDRIAQGSGGEVILVGDSVKNIFYVGVTNGSLDPTKHVYSKINLRPIVDALFINAPDVGAVALFPNISVVLMGDWIYVIVATSTNTPSITPMAGGMIYRHFYRVLLSDVQKTIDVTPVRQNLTFVDADGTGYVNSPWWKWYGITRTAEGATQELFSFSPLPANVSSGNYRSQPVLTAEDPTRKGVYGMKFLSAYYAAYTGPIGSRAINFVPEITYDFVPATGVFTLKSKSDLPPPINFNNAELMPAKYNPQPILGFFVFTFSGQGLNILEDGRVACSGAAGFSGFPRMAGILEVTDSKTRYATVSKPWGNGPGNIKFEHSMSETISSPLESSINVKAVMYSPGVEYYIAGAKNNLAKLAMFRKAITGKFALRPEITNLYRPNVVSRPLTTSIRRINALPGLGGMTISVPTNKLDSFGIEVGQSAFCVNAQGRHFRRNDYGDAWGDSGGLDDIILTGTHTDRLDPDGTCTIVPGIEIFYPAALVNLLKGNVQYPTISARARQCIVTICDPTYSGMDRFGWLPVLVAVTYADALGLPTSNTMFVTYMVIQPTYMVQGNRRVATGFTVLDKFHYEGPAMSIADLRIFNGYSTGPETPQTTIGPMRANYYLEGSKLNIRFCTGVIGQTISDSVISQMAVRYDNRDTKRWSYIENAITASRDSSHTITPDNGITMLDPWDSTSGGAATLTTGPVNTALIGSVYPEVGWVVFFKTEVNVVFNGGAFILPAGSIDLRDIDLAPQNKTFYIYARLVSGVAMYEITQEKRLETNYQLWVGRVVTNDKQIITLERFNVAAVDGHRISETKRGNSIPASSGLINAEGQLPWLRPGELLP